MHSSYSITGFGVLFLLAKTIVMAFYKPVQVIDLEHPKEEMMVQIPFYIPGNTL